MNLSSYRKGKERRVLRAKPRSVRSIVQTFGLPLIPSLTHPPPQVLLPRVRPRGPVLRRRPPPRRPGGHALRRQAALPGAPVHAHRAQDGVRRAHGVRGGAWGLCFRSRSLPFVRRPQPGAGRQQGGRRRRLVGSGVSSSTGQILPDAYACTEGLGLYM